MRNFQKILTRVSSYFEKISGMDGFNQTRTCTLLASLLCLLPCPLDTSTTPVNLQLYTKYIKMKLAIFAILAS